MMTNPGNTKLLVRTLKGAPLSCLLALALADGPLQVGQLGMLTGYSPHPVSQALKILSEIGLAQAGKQRSNWRITPQASQLFASILVTGGAQPANEDREKRDSGPASLTTTAAVKNLNNLNLTAAVAAAFKTAISEMGLAYQVEEPADQPPTPETRSAKSSSRHNRRGGRKRRRKSLPGSPVQESPRPDSSPAPAPDILKALHQAGIYEPTASDLARMPHVTLEYVQAHARKAQSDHIPTGLLIHRIRNQDPLPQKTENRNRYISGEFAEFINH